MVASRHRQVSRGTAKNLDTHAAGKKKEKSDSHIICEHLSCVLQETTQHQEGQNVCSTRDVKFRWQDNTARRVKGGGEVIDLKSFTQMTDFRDFRYPYRFETLYCVEV